MFIDTMINRQINYLRKRTGLMSAGVLVMAILVALGVVLSQQPILALLVLGAAVSGIIILAWPNVAVSIAMFILYSNIAVIAVKFHDAPYIIGLTVPGLLVVPLIHSVVLKRERVVINRVTVLVIVYLLIQIMSTLFSRDIEIAASNLFVIASEGVLLYLMVTNTVRTKKTLQRAIWALLIAGILMGGLPLFQQLTGSFDNQFWGLAQVQGSGFGTGAEGVFGEVRQARLSGPIGEKNFYSQIMAMLFPIALFQIFNTRSKLEQGLAAFATAMVAAGMGLAFSRGTAVAFVLVLVSALLLRIIRPREFMAMALAGVLLLAMLPQYWIRLESLESLLTLLDSESGADVDSATERRIVEMQAAGLVFFDHPVIGVGPGMFKYYSTEYGNLIGTVRMEGTRQAHTLYLEIAAEHGILGLAAFLAMLILTIQGLRRNWLYWQGKDPGFSFQLKGVALAIVMYMATGLFLHQSYMRYFWVVFGLAVAALSISSQTTSNTESQT